jgi:hypothetical protein
MKEIIALTLIGIAALFALASLAKAEQITFKNKCGELLHSDPTGFECYNKSQGADNAERLAQWKIIKKRLKARGYKIPAKVVLNDPQCTREYCDYIGKLTNRALHLPILSGCLRLSTMAAFRAYGGKYE